MSTWTRFYIVMSNFASSFSLSWFSTQRFFSLSKTQSLLLLHMSDKLQCEFIRYLSVSIHREVWAMLLQSDSNADSLKCMRIQNANVNWIRVKSLSCFCFLGISSHPLTACDLFMHFHHRHSPCCTHSRVLSYHCTEHQPKRVRLRLNKLDLYCLEWL